MHREKKNIVKKESEKERKTKENVCGYLFIFAFTNVLNMSVFVSMKQSCLLQW